jgi:long-chain acyl-CoA synthetase
MEQAVRIAVSPANIACREIENIERFGTYTRLYFEDRCFTNADELERAGKLARVLYHYGVRRGDRVVVMLPNSPELTASFQAIWTLGAAIVPIIPQWTAGEVLQILRSARPAFGLSTGSLAARMDEANAEVKTLRSLLVFGESEAVGARNILRVLDDAVAIESPADCASSDMALLLYTSGTTGMPKGVMLTHENLGAAFDSACRQNPNMPRGTMLNALPFTHVYGVLAHNVANQWGLSTVLLRHFDPLKALEAIERYRVNYLPGVPTMLMYLLRHPDRRKFDVSSLTRITSGGAPLPEALREECEAAFECRVDQGYGLSESAAVATGYEIERPYRPGSAGVASPRVEIRILDEKGWPVAQGVNGEICIKGANVMEGYWQDPTATREAFLDGWLHTGDIGYLDEEGYLFITDRKKDLIIKGGENISPREIEEVLYLHPAVAEAAVVGVPHSVYGEDIWAVLQLKAGVDAVEEELRLHVAQHVTKFKVPSRVIFQASLPKNPSGKILKQRIRAGLLESEPG